MKSPAVWKGLAVAIGANVLAVVAVEGGFVDHPSDPGGATNHGVTERADQLGFHLTHRLQRHGNRDEHGGGRERNLHILPHGQKRGKRGQSGQEESCKQGQPFCDPA